MPEKQKGFPWVVAAILAVCTAVCAWTWLRYSYAWELDRSEMPTTASGEAWARWRGRYVSVQETMAAGPGLGESPRYLGRVELTPESDSALPPNAEQALSWLHRVQGTVQQPVYVRRGASRFTIQSVGGIAVLTASLLHFALAMRRWRRP